MSLELVKSGRSLRDVSLKTGNAESYLAGVLSAGKEPSVGNLVRTCEELGVSVCYILTGIKMNAEQEQILKATQDNPDISAALLTLLNSNSSG